MTAHSDISFERAAVGAAITLGTPLPGLTGEDFQDTRLRFVWERMQEMAAAGIPIDQLTVLGYVTTHGLTDPGAPRVALGVFLHDLAADAPVASSGTYYASQVIEAASRRHIASAAAEISRVALAGSLGDLGTVLHAQSKAAFSALTRARRAAH